MPSTFKIGLFAIGLEAYWTQFPDLKKRLDGYLDIVNNKLAAIHPEIINAGFVDTAEKAFDAGDQFRKEGVEIIFLYVTTYALSATVLPVLQKAKVPVIILNLSPVSAIDYIHFNKMGDRTAMTGEWLAHCSTCTVPELINVFNRSCISFQLVTGMLENDDTCWSEIKEWIEAAKVAFIMQHNRLGCLGHYYSGMLDIYTDLTQIIASFGGYVEIIEVEELVSLRKQVGSDEIKNRVRLFHDAFEIQPDCTDESLDNAARTSVALDKLAANYRLGSLAYYYKGEGNIDNEEAISSIIVGNSLLTA